MDAHHITNTSVYELVIPELVRWIRSNLRIAEPEFINQNPTRKMLSVVLNTSAGGSLDFFQISFLMSDRWWRWSPKMLTRRLVKASREAKRVFLDSFGSLRFRFGHVMIVPCRFTKGVRDAIREWWRERGRKDPPPLWWFVKKFAPELEGDDSIDWETRIILLDITEYLRRARISPDNARRYLHIVFAQIAKAFKILSRFYEARTEAIIDRLREYGIEKPYGFFKEKIKVLKLVADAFMMFVEFWQRYLRARLLSIPESEAKVESTVVSIAPSLYIENDRWIPDDRYEIVK